MPHSIHNRSKKTFEKSRQGHSRGLAHPEALEPRLVMANPGPVTSVLAVVTDGRLTIAGSDYDDTIEVSVTDAVTVVRTATRRDGEVISGALNNPFVTYSFPSRSLTSISLQAGLGDDTVFVSSSLLTFAAPAVAVAGNAGDDFIAVEGIASTVSGDAGNDTLALADSSGFVTYASSPAGVNVDLQNHITYDDGFGTQDLLRGVTHVEGSAFADTLVGSDGPDTIKGLDGNDVIEGGAGDDVIDGGAGRDEVTFKRAVDSSVAGPASGITIDLIANRATGEGSDLLIAIEDAYGSSGADTFIFSVGNRVVGGPGDDTFIRNGATIDTKGINPNVDGAMQSFVAASPEVLDLFTEFWDEFQTSYSAASASIPSADSTRLNASLMKFFGQIAVTPENDRYDGGGLGLLGFKFENTPFDPETYKSAAEDGVTGVSNIVKDGTHYAQRVASHWGDVITQFGTDIKTFVMAGAVTLASGFINFAKSIGDACVDFYTDLATAFSTPDPLVALLRFGGAFSVFARNLINAPTRALFDVAIDLGFQFYAQIVGRPLNASEKEVARSVFGSNLDLGPIRVVTDSGAVDVVNLFFNIPAQTLGQSLYFRREAPPPRLFGWSMEYESLTSSSYIRTLVHELAHVWQKQQLNSVAAKAVGEHISNRPFEKDQESSTRPVFLTTPWDFNKAYYVGMDGSTRWKSLGVEAQAAAVENLFSFLEVTSSLARVKSIAEASGYSLRDAVAMYFSANPDSLVERSTVNPNSFPGRELALRILESPDAYALAFAGLPKSPEFKDQPYQGWKDYFRVVYTEAGLFRSLFRNPWPGFLSRDDSWKQSLETNLTKSRPAEGFFLNAYPSIRDDSYTFAWTTPGAGLGNSGTFNVYLGCGLPGADFNNLKEKRAVISQPNTAQTFVWFPKPGEDYTGYEFRIYVENDNGVSSSAPAVFALAATQSNAVRSAPPIVSAVQVPSSTASSRQMGQGFTVSVDAVRSVATFVGDQSVGSGGSANDSLFLWESEGFLNHNCTAGDYLDSSDCDPGPGVRRIPSQSCEIFVDAGRGDDFVDASGLRAALVTIRGGDGNDVLHGADTTSGYADHLFGDAGADSIYGWGGDDWLDGGLDGDLLDGGLGNDSIVAGDGDDSIYFGLGLDRVDGGLGKDRAVFFGSTGPYIVSTFEGRPVVLAAGDGSSGSLFGINQVEDISVRGSDAADSIVILDTSGTATVSVDSGRGDDHVWIGGGYSAATGRFLGNFARIQDTVVIDCGEGQDVITILDNETPNDRDYSVGLSKVKALSPKKGATQSMLSSCAFERAELVELKATDGVNRIDVIPSTEARFLIDGGLPLPGSVLAAQGDYLAIDTMTGFPASEGGLDRSGRKLVLFNRGTGRWVFDESTGRKPVDFESIERFNHVDRIAVAPDAGRTSSPIVRVHDAETMAFLFEIPAAATYGDSYRDGIRVATGDLDNDGIPDIVTAPGRMAAPVIKVFNGAPIPGVEGAEIAGLRLPAAATYGEGYRGGVNVAVGDVVGDRMNDIVLSPDRGKAIVKVFRTRFVAGDPFPSNVKTAWRSFDAFPDFPQFIGGANVATANLTGNGRSRIVVGSGSGMDGLVRVFNVRAAASAYTASQNISGIFDRGLGGVRVAVGDVDGDGRDDLVMGSGPAGGTWLKARKGGALAADLFQVQIAAGRGSTVPTRFALRDFNGDGRAEVIAAFGADARTGYRLARLRNRQATELDSLNVVSAAFSGGGVNLG